MKFTRFDCFVLGAAAMNVVWAASEIVLGRDGWWLLACNMVAGVCVLLEGVGIANRPLPIANCRGSKGDGEAKGIPGPGGRGWLWLK